MKRRRGFPADDSDGQSNPSNGDPYRGNFLQREFLLPASNHVQQNPHRRGILHDDCDGDARFLNGHVIEVIRRGYAEHSEHEALDQIGLRQLDALPPAPSH